MSEKYYVEFYKNLGYTVWEKDNGKQTPNFIVCVDKKYQAYKICSVLNNLYHQNQRLKKNARIVIDAIDNGDEVPLMPLGQLVLDVFKG